MRKFKVYHTVNDSGDPDYIEDNIPFKSTGKHSWVGYGYYFWETFIDFAHIWGKHHYHGQYVICSGKLSEKNEDDCLDLVGNTEHCAYLEKLIELVKNELEGKDVLLRHVIEYAREKELLPHKIIRLEDIPRFQNLKRSTLVQLKDSGGSPSYLSLRPKVVLYVFALDEVDLSKMRIEYPDEYVDGYVA